MEYVEQQLSSCWVLLMTGMVLGLFFDFYRVFRGRAGFKSGRGLFGALADLVFWCLALILIGPLIFWSTWLELRFFVWLLIIAGLIFYFVLFSRTMLPLIRRFWNTALWLPRQVAIILTVCFGWVGRFFRREKLKGNQQQATGNRE